MRSGRAKAGALIAVLLVLGTAAIAAASVIQSGNLRVTVLAQVEPPKLPRKTPAPIAVFISGHVGTVDGAVPPQLQTMTVKVNRHGLLQSKGLPVCHLPEIQPGSTERALDDCSDALVGSGRFWASVVFPDQRPYPTRGRLLVFNGRVGTASRCCSPTSSPPSPSPAPSSSPSPSSTSTKAPTGPN